MKTKHKVKYNIFCCYGLTAEHDANNAINTIHKYKPAQLQHIT